MTPDNADSGVTVTPLELRAQALVACVQAWTYPADPVVRAGAAMSCEQLGMDYVYTMSQVIEHMVPSTAPLDKAMHAARWAVVDFHLTELSRLIEQGATPRDDISQGGRPVDDLGNEIDNDNNDESEFA